MDPKVPLLRQRSVVGGSQILRNIYAEMFALTPLVTEWVNVPTSGSAICKYNQPTGRTYKVSSQWGDVGNLVHELTHVAVNEAYGYDFINYRNVSTLNVPARTFTPSGFASNEFDRQTRLMNDAENVKIQATLQKLKTLAGASSAKGGLSGENSTKVVSKLDYGYQTPHKEFDTVINQVLVWLTEWGYPVIGAKKGKVPAANLLFYEIEKVAAKNWWSRVQGYAANAA